MTDRHDDRVLLDERIAIAELAGVRALGDDAGEIFHQIIADQSRVPRGALARQDEALGAHEVALNAGQAAEHDAALALFGAAAQAVPDRRRLLEDLLEHVML